MALQWVTHHRNDDPANPIKVINLAYGTDSDAIRTSDPLLYAVENAFFNGITVVVSGGNAGTTLGRLNNPAVDPYVVKVGSAATQGTVSQADDQLSSFTSVSPTTQLDVLAPGESIVSLRDQGSAIDVDNPIARVGKTLFRGSGSSQAAAVVAGAVALLYQKAPKTTSPQMRQWLRASAQPLTGFDPSLAVGEINVTKALAQGVPYIAGNGGTGSSRGTGPLEDARGTTHVVHNTTTLRGTTDIFGTFSTTAWVNAIAAGTAWKGGLWMGRRVTGDGWTGSSWASKTWAYAGWSGNDWAGQAWADPSWSGHYWSGRAWSGDDWSGHYWSAQTWSTASWN
jgi:serine protease AprX